MKVLAWTLFTFVTIVVAPAYADLEPLDPAIRNKQLAQAEKLYANKDVDDLLKLLKQSHLFIKREVALMLGRLGADKALPILRQYDQSYSRFACAESGQFGVAVILIENKTPNAQKKALLAVAAEAREKGKHPHSVVDAAGRELSRYEGDDIIKALADIRTYGAQYTVLEFQCKKLSESDAISKSIAVLEAHETPQKAQAAEQILITFGRSAKLPVEKLKARVEKRIKSTDPTFTISKTICNRCNGIVKQIEEDEKANKSNAADASTLRPDRAAQLAVSPDGKRIAYREGPGRIVVRDLEDGAIRELTVSEEGFRDIAWLGNSRIVGGGGDEATTLPVVSLDGKRQDPISLPKGADILYRRFSPDGSLMAFVGRRKLSLGRTEHGLFIVSSRTGETRRVLEEALKTTPAWSPDSARLAIGGAPGYRRSYPLVLIDADGGLQDLSGIQGVGAAWSPDGRFIAFVTEAVRGGSWSAGIPTDGRVAVLDLDTGRVTPVTPSGVNRKDQVSGCLNPIWSPDSQWIVCQHRHTPPPLGDSGKWHSETWVARRDGSALLKAFDGYPSVAWTPDSQGLVFVEDGELHRLPLNTMAPVNAEGRAHE